MRIAIAQIKTVAGDFAATADRMVELSEQAAEKGVDLLVFPANTLCSPAPVPLVEHDGYLIDLMGAMEDLMARSKCPSIVTMFAEVDGTQVAEPMLIQDGGCVPLRLMAFFESMAAKSGEDQDAHMPSLPEVEVAGARLGVALTYDDLDDYDEYAFDVNVILYLGGYGFAMDDPSSALGPALMESRFVGDARTTSSWIVGAGSLGCCDGEIFTGSSFVLAPWGELAAQAPALEEALLVCDVDPGAEGPLAAPVAPEVFDRPLASWSALSFGLAETCAQLGVCDVAVLVDGRLGSAAVAALATDTFGPTHVHALLAPNMGPIASTASRELCRNLRVDVRETPASIAGEKDRQLAGDLAQAHLGALAREIGGIALSSLDKTAMALELDGRAFASGLAPLGDVYRTDVISLAHMRNTVSPVIPTACRDAWDVPGVEGIEACAPTPETQLSLIDYVLASHVEWELPVTEIVDARGHADVVLSIIRRLSATANLRRQAPPALVMSSKTLEEVARPLGLVWEDRVREKGERIEDRLAELTRPRGQGTAEAAGPSAPADDEMAANARDLLGLLRDVSLGGGMGPFGPEGGQQAGGRHSSEGRGNLDAWENPFSEN